MMDVTRHPELASRRVIDVAVGILVGLRRCSEKKAFEEIAEAVHLTGVPLGDTAGALVALATGTGDPSRQSAEALRRWADRLPAISTTKW